MRIAAASIVDPRTKLWSQNLEDTRLGLLCQKKKGCVASDREYDCCTREQVGGGGVGPIWMF